MMEGLGLNFLFNDGFIQNQWKNHCQHLGHKYYQMIQNKEITLGDKTMRFTYQMIGPKPPHGYTLFIGMHGGGGCDPEDNEEQYKNHQHLYQDQIPEGVIWFTPRSCEEAWDMWFKAYLVEFFNIVIKGFVLTGLVDPNKVFISGYSAGGDGTYHMTPMMADSWAGAAMMAGHPNGVQLYNLRNISFSIQMGGQDSSYKRNEVAREYIEKMSALGEKYGNFTTKYCNIFQECSHWMNLRDAEIFPSLLKEVRNPYPIFILFKQHDRLPKQYFYYIGVNPHKHKELLIVYQRGNTFNIQSQNMPVTIYVNRHTINYLQEVIIYHNGIMTCRKMPTKNAIVLQKSIRQRMDPFYIFEDCFQSYPNRDRVPMPFNPHQVVNEQNQVKKHQRF